MDGVDCYGKRDFMFIRELLFEIANIGTSIYISGSIRISADSYKAPNIFTNFWMKKAFSFFGFDSNIAILNNITNSEYFIKIH